MRHQVFVPVPAERLRAALADPARVARALPGLQQDAGAEPVTGRLKLRVGGHSVTYRGTARAVPRDDGTYALEADATEARGTGSVKLALVLGLADADGGTLATVEGTADADGRIAELPAETVAAAATRLLTRFLEGLADPDTAEPREAGTAPADDHTSVVDTEVPPPSLAAEADDDQTGDERIGDERIDEERMGDERIGEERVSDERIGDRRAGEPVGPLTEGFGEAEPPAEAAHARRTMIGRSAEEVDHAPPRGRYAPVPAPQTVTGNPALRWAAPAAALALASAVVVGRALRKRR
ncbi:SRPBCC domain-containing protein [Streptomyces sp. LP11]|uniref:SRPBCC domain-containing protein n=1 Tax=Streptomyces pyxinicus TaxID=2970331 RepID=A0ABT2AYA9_9ACTN|nr:SRPBCC family protein [Streptomyces sp. LP11]MCS0601229.1 SRPBCC domain-containing protein [Streptomyces sp. LP11]